MRKLRVLFVTEKWFPEGGGAEIFFDTFAKKLMESGFHVHVLSGGRFPNALFNYHKTLLPGVPKDKVLTLSGFFYRLLFILFLVPSILRIIKKEEIDVIHTLSPICCVPAFFGGRILNRIVIVSVRAFAGKRWFTMVGNHFVANLFYLTEKWSLGLPYDKIVPTLKDFGEEFAYSPSKKEKIVYLTPNAVDIDRFNPNVDGLHFRENLRIDDNSFVVMYSSTIASSKGIYYLVNAFQKAHEKIPKSKLVFVGTGKELPKLKDFVTSMNLDDSVIFTGKIGYNKMPDVFAASDVVVRPGLTEGMPRTVLEAFACGKTVIATSVGGTPEIVLHGETGFLVEPMDEEKMAEYIIELGNNPVLREQLGNNGRKLVESKYTYDRIRNDFINLYKSVISSRFKPRP